MSSRSQYVKSFSDPLPKRYVHHADNYRRDGNLFTIDGIATVEAQPHRRPKQAREFAQRIAAHPAMYLPLLIGLQVPGITDLRPTSHARPGFVSTAKGGE